MNIIVQTYEHKIVFRPDTSRKRDEDDLYVPGYIDTLSYTPVVYIKMDRPGKCISSRFASRYYSSAAYGLLLYPENLIDESPESYASAICIDRFSCLSKELDSLSLLERLFELRVDGSTIFQQAKVDKNLINEAIELASSRCFLRTGDTLAIELSPRRLLCTRDKEETIIKADKAEFKIIF